MLSTTASLKTVCQVYYQNTIHYLINTIAVTTTSHAKKNEQIKLSKSFCSKFEYLHILSINYNTPILGFFICIA